MSTLPALMGKGSWSNRLGQEPRLVAQATLGDRSAFDELVSLHQSEIRRYISKKIVHESVDDVLQDVWIAAWAALPNFDHRSRFKTWVYGICLHKIRDHYRSIKRSLPEVELSEQIAIADASGVDSALVASLPSMLAQLTESQREVLELYYFSQLNLPEISRALNRNLNTVKYQFYRAHSELAEQLKEEAL